MSVKNLIEQEEKQAQRERQQKFDELMKNKTIVKIDATSINKIQFQFDDGTIASVWGEELHYGIPVLTCENN